LSGRRRSQKWVDGNASDNCNDDCDGNDIDDNDDDFDYDGDNNNDNDPSAVIVIFAAVGEMTQPKTMTITTGSRNADKHGNDGSTDDQKMMESKNVGHNLEAHVDTGSTNAAANDTCSDVNATDIKCGKNSTIPATSRTNIDDDSND